MQVWEIFVACRMVVENCRSQLLQGELFHDGDKSSHAVYSADSYVALRLRYYREMSPFLSSDHSSAIFYGFFNCNITEYKNLIILYTSRIILIINYATSR